MIFIAVVLALVVAVSPVSSAQLGEICETDRDCTNTTMECIFRFEECTEKACWCKPDYSGRFATRCIKVLAGSERCIGRLDVTCPYDAYCDRIKDNCVARIPAGQDCEFDRYNCTDYARCDLSAGIYTCTCYSQYVQENGKCKKTQWNGACTLETCKTNVDMYCITNKCSCFNSSFTHMTFKENGGELDACVPTSAQTNIGVDGACKLGDTNSNAQLCAESLTCSQCLLGDAPTCITPGGGADDVKAHVFCFITTLLMSRLLW